MKKKDTDTKDAMWNHRLSDPKATDPSAVHTDASRQRETEAKDTDQKETDGKKRAKRNKRVHSQMAANGWLMWGICISLLLSVLFTSLYGIFQIKSRINSFNPLETESNISWIYQNSYLLYRDLYNKVNHTNLSFKEIYLVPEEKYAADLWRQSDEESYYGEAADKMEDTVIPSEDFEIIRNTGLQLDAMFAGMENEFYKLNTSFDYLIEDLNSGTYVTNLLSNQINPEDQFFYISFLFDADGNATVESNIRGNNTTSIRKDANAVVREFSLRDIVSEWVEENGSFGTEIWDYISVNSPANCRVTYCVSNASWDTMQKDGFYYANGYYRSDYSSFINSGIGGILFLFLTVVFLLALFMPKAAEGDPWSRFKVCRMPLEAVFVLVLILFAFAEFIIVLAHQVNSRSMTESLLALLGTNTPMTLANGAVYLFNIFVVASYFFCVWFLGICFRMVRNMGIKEYIRRKCIIYRIFPYVKLKLKEMYYAVSHFDVTRKAHKLIMKIVLVNGVILFFISSLWMGGLAVAIIYSAFLYFILRRYISDLQQKYGILLGAINKIAGGDLNVVITEDLGVFEPFKPQVLRIQNGFRKAVDEEVKSQRMKAELITNVSHDLKTPLTAIITYINLLKEENVTEEQRKEYLDTLERKSIRLKVLIEDLFEVSKANSGNMTLNIIDVDVVNLIRQVAFEMSDKLADSQLDIRLNLPEEKIILPLDSQKTYRIYENLFGNIAKYALKGTRVYVDTQIRGDELEIILKNITAEEIRVNVDELTDRFVRGDVSRNTEGSGLGLAIVKGFLELQNGRLSIQVDGDLFKVSTIWKLPPKNEAQKG